MRRGIGHSPEGRRVFANMSVRENLELGAYTPHGPRPASGRTSTAR